MDMKYSFLLIWVIFSLATGCHKGATSKGADLPNVACDSNSNFDIDKLSEATRGGEFSEPGAYQLISASYTWKIGDEDVVGHLRIDRSAQEKKMFKFSFGCPSQGLLKKSNGKDDHVESITQPEKIYVDHQGQAFINRKFPYVEAHFEVSKRRLSLKFGKQGHSSIGAQGYASNDLAKIDGVVVIPSKKRDVLTVVFYIGGDLDSKAMLIYERISVLKQ